MTRKDYILIADALKATFTVAKNSNKAFTKYQKELIFNEISNKLYRDNYRFDYDKFENYIFNK